MTTLFDSLQFTKMFWILHFTTSVFLFFALLWKISFHFFSLLSVKNNSVGFLLLGKKKQKWTFQSLGKLVHFAFWNTCSSLLSLIEQKLMQHCCYSVIRCWICPSLTAWQGSVSTAASLVGQVHCFVTFYKKKGKIMEKDQQGKKKDMSALLFFQTSLKNW